MILAAAQIQPLEAGIEENIRLHSRMVETAAGNNVDLIIFPEMSLTGYERENAKKLAFSTNDPRLAGLRDQAKKHNMYIIAGAPIEMGGELYIGSFILQPAGLVSIYIKQYLHDGEEAFFSSSFAHNPVIDLRGERFTLAICADIDVPRHAADAAKQGFTIYLASIFFSQSGIQEAHQILGGYAKEHSMNVLMANFYGTSWGLLSGGKSAFWNQKGELIQELDPGECQLLLVEKIAGSWKGEKVACDLR